MTTNEILWLTLAQLWQVTLLILLVWLLTRWLARNRPHLAHALWLVVLVKCVTPPLWSSPSGLFCWLQPAVDESVDHVSGGRPGSAALSAAWHPMEKPNREVVVQMNRTAVHSAPTDESAAIERARTTHDNAAAMPNTVVNESVDWFGRAASLLVIVWLGGALCIASTSGWRMLRCWRMLRSADRVDDPQLEARFLQLARRLRIRRRVRLWITCSRVGPAVVGLFRPTVILPAAVIEGKTPAQLEPILAHELLHIRRGDLWIGLVQTLAQALWWFHPLVWLMSRVISREAERCCDEQAIAELGCPPGDYARSLLDVLALKRTLVIVPAFPGVRPVEVTSKRLERIMQLGQGCRRRTPWWCYLVLLVFAALALPGAAFRATAGEPAVIPSAWKETEPNAAADGLWQRDKPSGEVRLYNLDELLERMTEHHQGDREAARRHIADWLHLALDSTGRSDEHGRVWSDDALVVLSHAAGHRKVAHLLAAARQHGIREIKFEIRICSAPQTLVDEIVGGWELLPTSDTTMQEKAALGGRQPLDEGARLKVNDAGDPLRGDARQTIEKHMPLLVKIVDDEGRKSMLRKLQSHAQANVLTCPKVTLFDGQAAHVKDAVQRPFVVGFKPQGEAEPEPQIRVIEEGLSLRLEPVLQDERRVHLDCELALSDIRSVDEATIRRNRDETPLKVQVPEVATTKVSTTIELQGGETLILGGLSRKSGERRETEALLLMINIELAATGQETQAKSVNIHAEPTETRPKAPAAFKTWKDLSAWRRQRMATPREEGDAEEKLEAALKMKVTVDFQNTPLSKVMARLSQTAGVNIVLNAEGLAKEGVTPNTPVTIQLEQPVSLRSTLQLVLEPLHLDYEFHDEVMEVTDEQTVRDRRFTTITYYVADLVVPIADGVVLDGEKGIAPRANAKARAVHFDALIGLLKALNPSAWEDAGGRGSIAAFETNLSLVVRQNMPEHEQIADLLEQMRRLQDLQVALTLEAVRIPNKAFREKFQHLRAAELVDRLRSDDAVRIEALPRVTLFQGQGVEIPVRVLSPQDKRPAALQIVPTVSSDRRTVKLKYTVDADDALSALSSAQDADAPDGAPLVFDVTEELLAGRSQLPGIRHSAALLRLLVDSDLQDAADRVLIIATPQIIVRPEEEERPIGRPWR